MFLCFYFTTAARKEENSPFTSAEASFAYFKQWGEALDPVVVK
ncbi:MAG: hypothetical protein Q8904_06960 [Bacteroidota bacterium]|nr:hypothetical protein [Bacteroidota bacterium]